MKYLITLTSILLFSTLALGQSNTVYYEESFEDFPNPERGFYRYSSTYADPYNNLKEEIIRPYRELHKPFSADYHIHSTLVFRYFFLEDFVDSPISQDFLDNMEKDFEVLRKSGLKLIVRFAYTERVNDEGCNSWVCPPYGDAPKERVLEHIAQLKPVLQANYDVIAVVQLGFIGIWGEGYYTDYFGDASDAPYILTEQNWNDRNEILNALLDAVPVERQIQVRYPQVKQKNIFGALCPTTSPAMAKAQAHNGSATARIGHHNDCFLASSTDFGTFQDYGPPKSKSDTITLKPYVAKDSRFVAVGGETCSTYNPYDDCASNGGRADTEMRRFNYSYLNSQYNNSKVNNEWVEQGCIEEIKRNLGYRFVLTEGSYPSAAFQGEKVDVSISLKNVGYAPPFNPRDVELILINKDEPASYRLKLDEDPRFWESGAIYEIAVNACLPKDMVPGEYEFYLNLPDPEPTLNENSDFSIRLANKDVWKNNPGYNKLFSTLQVNQKEDAVECEDGLVFELFDHILSVGDMGQIQFYEFYPNPVKNELNIEAKNPFHPNGNYSIYSMFGELVRKGDLPAYSKQAQINLEGLPQGSYFVTVRDFDQTHSERMIVIY
jgi:hypothetical protein